MRAKWRKAIWAILALQLLLWHIFFLVNNMWPDYFVNRVVNHFGLPYVLYLYWKKLAVLISHIGSTRNGITLLELYTVSQALHQSVKHRFGNRYQREP